MLQAQWGKLGAEVDVQGTVDAAFTCQRRAENDWEAFIEQWNTVGDAAVVHNRASVWEPPLDGDVVCLGTVKAVASAILEPMGVWTL